MVEGIPNRGEQSTNSRVRLGLLGENGRPPIKLYDWAWEQIYVEKRDATDVYWEWLKRWQEAGNLDQQESRDCFDHAMSRRRKKSR